jgi:hypothetical protein
MSDDIKSLVPNIDKMTDHKCLHCGQIVLSVPGKIRTLYCISGLQHEDEPSMWWGIWSKKIPVTVFSFNGEESKKAWMTFE